MKREEIVKKYKEYFALGEMDEENEVTIDFVEHCIKSLVHKDVLKEANDMLRSCYQTIRIKDKNTNWDALEKNLLEILERQAKFKLWDKKDEKKG